MNGIAIYSGINNKSSVPVVSLSLPEAMIREMDEIQGSLGFTGRSELVRAAIRLLLQDFKEKSSLSGKIGAVLVITHAEENEEQVTRIKHKFDGIVRTHIHTKPSKKQCIELFLVEGDASDVNSMTKEFQKDDGIRSVKLLVI
jgi:CopG family nickel-responsive transcriptional regulator